MAGERPRFIHPMEAIGRLRFIHSIDEAWAPSGDEGMPIQWIGYFPAENNVRALVNPCPRRQLGE
jgi:hypothetical protein